MKPFKKFTSEDLLKNAETEIDNIFNNNTEKIETMLKAKEKDLLKWNKQKSTKKNFFNKSN